MMSSSWFRHFRLFAAALAGFLFMAACAQQPSVAGDPSNDEDKLRYDSAKAHTDLGSAYYGNGQIGVALEELTLAQKIYPKYAPVYYMLGLVYMDLKDDAQAEQNFKKSLELDPTSSEAYNNYGWFLCQRGHIDEAIKQFMTALKNPRYETPDKPYVNAGICSRKRNDDAAAMEYFESALKLRPTHPQALYNAADIQFNHGDLAAAKSYLLRYMKSNAPTADVLWLGVRVERKLGDRISQDSYSDMLRKRFPDSREAQLLKAGRYE